MTVVKNRQGYIVITDIVANQLITKKYLGYSIKQARAKFRKELKQ